MKNCFTKRADTVNLDTACPVDEKRGHITVSKYKKELWDLDNFNVECDAEYSVKFHINTVSSYEITCKFESKCDINDNADADDFHQMSTIAWNIS